MGQRWRQEGEDLLRPATDGSLGTRRREGAPSGQRGMGCARVKETGTNLERVFCAEARGSGQAGKGVENEGQHGARGTLFEAGGALDARTPAGMARGTRSSNVLNIPPTKCPERGVVR